MRVEYKIVNSKYVEGYFMTLTEIEKLVMKFQTSDPYDREHLKTKESIEEYINKITSKDTD